MSIYRGCRFKFNIQGVYYQFNFNVQGVLCQFDFNVQGKQCQFNLNIQGSGVNLISIYIGRVHVTLNSI